MGSEDGENREEGELSEEGELPDDEPAEDVPAQEEAQKATSDSKPQADAPQQQAAAHSGRTASGPPAQQEQQQQQPVPLSRPRADPQPQQQQQLQRPREPHAREGSRERARGAGDHHHHASSKGGGDHDASRQKDRERDADKQKAEREKQELLKELDRLTYDVSFQEVRGNFVGACQDLKTAIKKLDKLLRRVKKKREDDVELYPSAFNHSSRIFNALKHVVVICSTGLGQLADMEPANALMRTAVNYRHDVFSLNHKRELEQQLRDSKEFRHLFTDRDKGRSSSKANGPAAGAGGGGAAGGSSRRDADQAEQRLPLQRGQPQQGQQPHSTKSDGMQTSASKDEAVSEASHAAAGATSSRGLAAPSSAAAAAATGEHAPSSPAGTASAVRSGGGPTPVAGPSPAADGPTSATPFAGPSYEAAGAASAAGASAAGGGAGGWGSSTGAGGGITSSRRGGPGTGAQGLIKIVVNSTSVTPPVAATAGAGSGAGASSSSGLKRPMPQIQDLDAEDEDEQQQQQQAAKRARQQEPPAAAAAAGSAGAGAANGLPLSELPEVAAAMHNPGQLQVVLQDLLGSHRLCLVLDLDHTLVNSAKFSEVDADWEYRLEQLAAEQLSRPKESRDLHRLARVAMWTKLRPGVREFLRRAAERFELWVYTAGSKAYADAMVELLDPSGQYFGGRVIAQGVPTGPDDSPADAVVFKRLMQGLEGREPVVVIVDDSSAVWPHDRRNLFVVERYIYFPSSRRRFGMQGKSLLEIERDECPSRGMLMTALRVFEHLHDLVFARMRAAPPAATPDAAAGWDVRNVMAAEKRQVLSGVHLVFSRVIPLESNPRQHPLWQLAEQFGATCGEQCNETTTHVVATHGGTEKVMWAKQNNKHVVSPAWLECSCILWQRANEDKFPTPL